jgi:hypothetical protein
MIMMAVHELFLMGFCFREEGKFNLAAYLRARAVPLRGRWGWTRSCTFFAT